MVGATAEKIAALPDKVNDGVAGPAQEMPALWHPQVAL
jgi:hypothetical protein